MFEKTNLTTSISRSFIKVWLFITNLWTGRWKPPRIVHAVRRENWEFYIWLGLNESASDIKRKSRKRHGALGSKRLRRTSKNWFISSGSVFRYVWRSGKFVRSRCAFWQSDKKKSKCVIQVAAPRRGSQNFSVSFYHFVLSRTEPDRTLHIVECHANFSSV